MKFYSSMVKVVAGAALFAIAVAPPAFAKKDKSSGSFSVGCLTSDLALQTALGITDASIAPVQVSISPGSLWPPNHKMHTESLSVNLTAPFIASPATPYDGDTADISVWIVGFSDDQAADDDAGGHGCGKPSGKQGLDWSPGVDIMTPGTYVSGGATLTDMTVTPLSFFDQGSNPVNVQLRAERCARDGTRTYAVSVVCCDTTGASPVCDDAALETTTPTEPSTTDDLNVEVLKSHGHHSNP